MIFYGQVLQSCSAAKSCVLLVPYVSTYGPALVGNHRDAFWLSSLCDLPLHVTAKPNPLRGKFIRSNLVRATGGSKYAFHTISLRGLVAILFSPRSVLRRSSIVWYVSLRKHLRIILSIILFLDTTALALKRSRQGHLWDMTIHQLLILAQPEPAATFGYQRLLPLHPTSSGDWPFPLSLWSISYPLKLPIKNSE